MRPSTDGLALDVSEQREYRLEADECIPCTRLISVAEVEVVLMGLEEEGKSWDPEELLVHWLQA